jgi:hypothetical protein
MRRCRYCREAICKNPEVVGARCPHCREPLYERYDPADDAAEASGTAGGSRCAVHAGNRAVGTCQRCGNYLCGLCWTRWRGRSLCVACVDRALTAREVAPEDARDHLRQGLLAVVLGVAAWVVAVAGAVVVVAGTAGEFKLELLVLGFFVLLASLLPSVLGIGQAAAAIRARGDHMILATAGLLLSGLHAGMVVGVLGLSLWQS